MNYFIYCMALAFNLCCFNSALLADAQIPDNLQPIIDNFKNSDAKSPWGKLNPNAPKEVAQFGQLVGIWSVMIKKMDQKGQWSVEEPAIWAWKYILDGYAVQDLYLQQQSDKPSTKITQLRHFDLKDNLWHIAWINTDSTKHGEFTATEEAGELVMIDPDKSELETPRIVFKDISTLHFVWEYRIYLQSQKKWLTVSVIKATKIEQHEIVNQVKPH